LDGIVGTLRVGPGRGARRFSVEVHNTGNLLLTTLGRIEVKQGSSTVAVIPVTPKQIYIIPNGVAKFTGVWKGTPWFGKRRATAMFTLSAFREPDIRRRSNTLTLSFFAWSIVILLILLIFAALVGREYRRRRSRREPTEPPTAITISAPAKADRVLVDQMEDEGSDSVEWYS
jgi:hypothetical protein